MSRLFTWCYSWCQFTDGGQRIISGIGYDNDNNAIGKPWVIFLLGEKSYKDVIALTRFQVPLGLNVSERDAHQPQNACTSWFYVVICHDAGI